MKGRRDTLGVFVWWVVQTEEAAFLLLRHRAPSNIRNLLRKQKRTCLERYQNQRWCRGRAGTQSWRWSRDQCLCREAEPEPRLCLVVPVWGCGNRGRAVGKLPLLARLSLLELRGSGFAATLRQL